MDYNSTMFHRGMLNLVMVYQCNSRKFVLINFIIASWQLKETNSIYCSRDRSTFELAYTQTFRMKKVSHFQFVNESIYKNKIFLHCIYTLRIALSEEQEFFYMNTYSITCMSVSCTGQLFSRKHCFHGIIQVKNLTGVWEVWGEDEKSAPIFFINWKHTVLSVYS